MAKKLSEASRVGRFGLVGVMNTAIDVTIYNIVSSGRIGLSLVQATYVSSTVAMIFSFFANRGFVFKSRDKAQGKQAVFFFVVTAVSVWVLQPLIIHLLTQTWLTPLNLGVKLADALTITKHLSADFLRKNGAKAAAILVGLVWNYTLYKKVVFKK